MLALHVSDVIGPSSGAFCTSCICRLWYVVICVLLDMSSRYKVVGKRVCKWTISLSQEACKGEYEYFKITVVFINVWRARFWIGCGLIVRQTQNEGIYTIPSRRHQWPLLHLVGYHSKSNTCGSWRNVPYCTDVCVCVMLNSYQKTGRTRRSGWIRVIRGEIRLNGDKKTKIGGLLLSSNFRDELWWNK